MPKMTITQRADTVPMLCRMCGTRFHTKFPARAKYCSLACRARAFRTNKRFATWQAAEIAKSTLIREELMKEAKAHAELADFDHAADQLLRPILNALPAKEQHDLLLLLRRCDQPIARFWIDRELQKLKT